MCCRHISIHDCKCHLELMHILCRTACMRNVVMRASGDTILEKHSFVVGGQVLARLCPRTNVRLSGVCPERRLSSTINETEYFSVDERALPAMSTTHDEHTRAHTHTHTHTQLRTAYRRDLQTSKVLSIQTWLQDHQQSQWIAVGLLEFEPFHAIASPVSFSTVYD